MAAMTFATSQTMAEGGDLRLKKEKRNKRKKETPWQS